MDFNKVASNSFEPLPAGSYNIISDDVQLKQTKSGGEMLAIKFRVLDGEQKGRFIFENYNIKNSNEKAVQIGLSQLKSFIQASKAPMNVESWTDLVGYKCSATTKIRHDEMYGDKAVISYYKELKADPTAETGLPF
jgi:hypothetical protein